MQENLPTTFYVPPVSVSPQLDCDIQRLEPDVFYQLQRLRVPVALQLLLLAFFCFYSPRDLSYSGLLFMCGYTQHAQF